jgi:hypothetical protein
LDLIFKHGQVWEDGVATKGEVYEVFRDAGESVGNIIVSIFGLLLLTTITNF